jgi:hypothetical protein
MDAMSCARWRARQRCSGVARGACRAWQAARIRSASRPRAVPGCRREGECRIDCSSAGLDQQAHSGPPPSGLPVPPHSARRLRCLPRQRRLPVVRPRGCSGVEGEAKRSRFVAAPGARSVRARCEPASGPLVADLRRPGGPAGIGPPGRAPCPARRVSVNRETRKCFTEPILRNRVSYLQDNCSTDWEAGESRATGRHHRRSTPTAVTGSSRQLAPENGCRAYAMELRQSEDCKMAAAAAGPEEEGWFVRPAPASKPDGGSRLMSAERSPALSQYHEVTDLGLDTRPCCAC